VPELELESVATLRELTAALVTDLARLGPFGHANRKPLLACRGLDVVGQPRRVGKTGEHLQLQVRDGTGQMRCIGFNYGKMFDQLHAGVKIDLAVEPLINEYNGRSSVELGVKDLKVVG